VVTESRSSGTAKASSRSRCCRPQDLLNLCLAVYLRPSRSKAADALCETAYEAVPVRFTVECGTVPRVRRQEAIAYTVFSVLHHDCDTILVLLVLVSAFGQNLLFAFGVTYSFNQRSNGTFSSAFGSGRKSTFVDLYNRVWDILYDTDLKIHTYRY